MHDNVNMWQDDQEDWAGENRWWGIKNLTFNFLRYLQSTSILSAAASYVKQDLVICLPLQPSSCLLVYFLPLHLASFSCIRIPSNTLFLQLFPVLLNYFSRILSAVGGKRKRARIRSAIRGHRILAKADRLHHVEDTIQQLRQFKLPLEPKLFSRIIWGSALPKAELIVRQRLSQRYIELQESLLVEASSNGCFVEAPIPKVWCDQLEAIGYNVCHLRCQFLWRVELARQICIGTCFALYSLFVALASFFVRRHAPSSYVFFCDLSAANLPGPAFTRNSFCFASWYVQESGDFNPRYILRHSASGYRHPEGLSYNLEFQQSPIPYNLSAAGFVLYALCLFLQLASIIYSFIGGRWWNILLYREAVISLRARLLDKDSFASQYWFHNSCLYPPLWSYELPAKGSQSIYYFYSTNLWPLPRRNGDRPLVTPYSIANWPEVCVWGRSHQQFLKNTLLAGSCLRYTGPIWFADNIENTPLPKNYLALFDVQPFRQSKYVKFCLPREFYVPKTCIAFVLDVVSAIAGHDFFVVLKIKRNIGSLAHPVYRKFIQDISSHPKVIVVSASVSASQIIKHSRAVVSMPFTSTAFLALAASKASIYYDPAAIFSPGDEYAGGVPLLNSKSLLALWINSVLRSH